MDATQFIYFMHKTALACHKKDLHKEKQYRKIYSVVARLQAQTRQLLENQNHGIHIFSKCAFTVACLKFICQIVIFFYLESGTSDAILCVVHTHGVTWFLRIDGLQKK